MIKIRVTYETDEELERLKEKLKSEASGLRKTR